ncbi:terpene synthase family protein [Streptosporangium sp. NPDC051023]|uniref:terpene synthase family protein n=1 Tax=Streptosporangium sp. NPDC051023 TaxID=3155410 RepID=UPI00344B9E4B
MRTQLHGPPGGTSPGIPLGERLAAMSVPCPMHPSVHRIEAAVIDWARRTGLDADPAAGVHLLAGRAFARHDTGTATLFACWLTWLSRLRREPSAFAGVLAVAGGGEPGPAPVERAFADLWRACAPGMSDKWRERFRAGLAAQRAALLGAGASSVSVEDYPARGRAGFGRYLFDLVEPCAGVEVPASVQESPRWRSVVEASGDVVTWCDDLATGGGYVAAASAFLHRETVPGTTTAPRTAPRTATGVTGETAPVAGAVPGTAVEWVVDRVVDRMEELWTAARTLPTLVERCNLGLAASREVIQVACAFLTIPRAYLEGLLESPRYRHLE